jgi:hypothetical protein
MAKSGSFRQSGSAIISKTVEKLSGIRLSDIEFVHPSKLQENDLNRKFFFEESNEYFEELRNDISKRGIIVPLIAKEDGTLLAGHNRLRVALELGKESVPVQYVVDNLSSDSERDFLVKDNLLRRQLSNEQRIKLYKVLYPDFEERFLNPDTMSKGGRPSGSESVVTIEKIAKDTGQSASAVRVQVKRMRDRKAQEQVENNRYNVTVSSPEVKEQKNENNRYNVTVITEPISDLPNFQSTLKHIEEFYVSSEPDTRKAVEDSLIQFMSKLSLIAENKA